MPPSRPGILALRACRQHLVLVSSHDPALIAQADQLVAIS
jgi:hypothetical protein